MMKIRLLCYKRLQKPSGEQLAAGATVPKPDTAAIHWWHATNVNQCHYYQQSRQFDRYDVNYQHADPAAPSPDRRPTSSVTSEFGAYQYAGRYKLLFKGRLSFGTCRRSMDDESLQTIPDTQLPLSEVVAIVSIENPWEHSRALRGARSGKFRY